MIGKLKQIKTASVLCVIAAALVLIMGFAVKPAYADTSGPVKYVDENGTEHQVNDYIVLDGTEKEIGGAGETWYVAKTNLTYSKNLKVKDNAKVNLILCDGIKMACKDNFTVNESSELKIWGQKEKGGSLRSEGGHFSGYAAIGGATGHTNGLIEIHSGEVTAQLGGSTVLNKGAAIGAGNGADGGKIYIYGGKVLGYCDGAGTGIGGGHKGAAGDIRISGGEVKGASDGDGAGIGSGEDFGSTQQAPYLSTTVTINGGTVTTTGGSNGAGIGGGSSTNGGRVSITGGSVFANGFFGAGIGGGSGASGGEVSITGGIVEVRAKGNNVKYGSGIGAGYSSNDQGSLELSDDAIVKASSKSGNNDDLKDLPLIDRASYLNDHSYRYVRIEMKNQRLKTGLKYRQTAQHEDKYYVRFVFVRPKSEFKNADKVIYTIHYKDETCTCESQYYYTSMISNGISYIPDSADSCLLVVTVSSSRNICDEATCDYELV